MEPRPARARQPVASCDGIERFVSVAFLIGIILCVAAATSGARCGATVFEKSTSSGRAKDVAIVHVGFVGKTNRNYDGPPNTHAARLGYESLLKRVVEPNAARGWTADIFFHTWNAELEGELVNLMHPAAHFVGAKVLDGFNYSRGVHASSEIALDLYAKHVRDARRGRPYDRIIIKRFDVVFFRDFLLDALSDDDTLYAANWCKAMGDVTLMQPLPFESTVGGPLVSASRTCRALVPIVHDIDQAGAPFKGLPDFWLVGSPRVVLPFFKGIFLWSMAHPAFKDYTRLDPIAGDIIYSHWVWGLRVLEQGVRLRRYQHHHMDFDMVRELACGAGARALCDATGLAWLDRAAHDLSPDHRSLCGQQSFCACSETSLTSCFAFRN